MSEGSLTRQRSIRSADIIMVGGVASAEADAAATILAGFVPRGRKTQPWPLTPPMDWDYCPFPGDNNWLAQLHMWRWLDAPLLLMESGTGDAAGADAVGWAMALAADWLESIEEERISYRSVWEGQLAGLRAQKIALLAALADPNDERAGLFDEQQRALIRDLVELHTNRLFDGADRRLHNHLIDELHGLAALARVQPDSVLAAAMGSEASSWLATLIAHQFDASGVCVEDGVGYHQYNLQRLDRILRSGWYPIELLSWLDAPRERVEQWRMPDGRLPSVGDTDLVATVAMRGAPVPKDPGQVEMVMASGYLSVKSRANTPPEEASYLFMMAACNSGVHKHADDLSLIWSESGWDLLIDPGKYAYHSDDWRTYFSGPSAHNTLSVNGSPFRVEYRAPVPPMLGDVVVTPESVVATGSIRQGADRWDRRVDFFPGVGLHVTDVVELSEPALVQVWWQLGQGEAHRRSDRGFVVMKGGDAALTMEVACVDGDLDLDAREGVESPAKAGWLSYSYGERSPSVTISASVRSAKTTISTRFALREAP